ncbi:hypothetical protein [Halorhabdus amylolytica]|uniref:hypothetical protein n=1 Tax=Halorhabdus amylolytica TaxID=2559573 RepID=UPI0010AAA6CF|nr:hypothetical protein [Halorhabdus amylolytica]
MSQVETHHVAGCTERHVIIDGETHAFEIPDDEPDIDAYEYLGDGAAPEPARDALAEWVAQYHDVESDDEPQESDEPEA